jgi:hypothetical protein
MLFIYVTKKGISTKMWQRKWGKYVWFIMNKYDWKLELHGNFCWKCHLSDFNKTVKWFVGYMEMSIYVLM